MLALVLFCLLSSAVCKNTTLPSLVPPKGFRIASVPEVSQSHHPNRTGTLKVDRPQPTDHRHLTLGLQRLTPDSLDGFLKDPSLSKRWAWAPLTKYGQGIVYLVELSLGSPLQKVQAIVDTGSYELFLNPNCSNAADRNICKQAGFYEPSESSTASRLNRPYLAVFGTGSMRGEYYNDTLSLDGLQVPSLQFGAASDSTYLFTGILGLGYGRKWDTSYPTLIDRLVDLGHIATPIFSTAFEPLKKDAAGTNDLVFGGVDMWKFSGWLQPLPLSQAPAVQKKILGQVQYWVNVTSIGLTFPAGQGGEKYRYTPSDFRRMMMVDTGSTYTYVDADVVAWMAQRFNAWIDERGVYFVNCSYRDLADGTVDFGFLMGGLEIRVLYRDFIVQIGNDCTLGFQAADAGVATWVLGDTFIRGAYMVFDQQNDLVWMAPYKNCGSGVFDIGKDSYNQLYSNTFGQC